MASIPQSSAHPASRWLDHFNGLRLLAAHLQPVTVEGKLLRANGLLVEACGLNLPLGSICEISSPLTAGDRQSVEAEVVGFKDGRTYLMPLEDLIGVAPGAAVCAKAVMSDAPRFGIPLRPKRRAQDQLRHLPIGDGLFGRVVDARGAPLDSLGALTNTAQEAIFRRPINAMSRAPIRQVLDTGVRSINALLSVGRGQRLGLFAGAGVGKSQLLGMMARYTAADVIVLGLIGERGREVKEFIEEVLGPRGLERCIVVAAPADTAPVLRMQAAAYATAIAEHYRDQGRQVLLLIDSLTRYAMAAREIALAIGEAPATKGYPASVFARLPQLVERAGNGDRGGSITAFYTVLTEGDDPNDPVADSARAILDGHIVLSRALADAGHYPAIDVARSISRVMPSITTDAHQNVARLAKGCWSRYHELHDLLALGAYVAGQDIEADQAMAIYPALANWLRQPVDDPQSFEASVAGLLALFEETT
jgi:flagellum-specific ATP synthase